MNRDWETLAKRLAMASHLGFSISYENGHRWLYLHEVDESDTQELLAEKDIPVRNKQYGGLVAVLDHIDTLLAEAEQPNLLAHWYHDEEVFGS